MFIAAVIISLVVAYLRGGKISYFEKLNFKLWYLLSVAFLIEFLAKNLQFINDTWFYILHLMTYVIIMYVVIINRHIPSMWLLAIGNLMNAFVIAVNQGKMPVRVTNRILEGLSGQPYFDRGHMLMTKASQLKFLGDIFTLKLPILPLSVFSLGDVFLVICVFSLVQEGMVAKAVKIESQEVDG